MPSIRPNGDAATGTWTTAPLHSKTSDQNSGTFIQSTAVGACTLDLENLGLDASTQRVIRARVKALAAVSGGMTMRVALQFPTGLFPSTAVIDVPGTPSDPGTVDWKTSPWQYKNNANDEISVTDIDGLQVVCSALDSTGLAAVTEIVVNVDYRNKATVALTNPNPGAGSFTTATIAPLVGHVINWSFDATNSNDAKFSQKKFQVKIFDQATAEGGGFDPDTSTPVYDSGEVKSSLTSHEYDDWSSGVAVARLTANTNYYAYVRAAQDFYGEDWWSDWTSARMKTETLPYLDSVAAGVDPGSTAPGIVWDFNSDNGYLQGGAEVRFYEDDGSLSTTDPDDNDPDLLRWSTTLDNADEAVDVPAAEGFASEDYRGYVRAFDDEHGTWSLWYYDDFTISRPAPLTPTLSAANDDANARNVLDVTLSDGDGGAGTALGVTADALYVERQVDGVWSPVRFYNPQEIIPADYALFSGVSGDGISTAGSSHYVGWNDFDRQVDAHVAPDDWTPATEEVLVNQWDSVAGQRCFKLALTTAGELKFYWSPDGTAVRSATSTADLSGQTNGAWLYVRANLDVTNQEVDFYTSTDGDMWSQLGSTVTVGGSAEAQSVQTEDIILGYTDPSSPTNHFNGKMKYAAIRSTIDGSDDWLFDVSTIDLGDREEGLTEPIFGIAMTVDDGVELIYNHTFYDYEAPLNVEATYRCRTRGYNASDYRTFSAWSATDAATIAVTDRVWLKAPADPSLNGSWPVADQWVVRTVHKRRAVQRPISQRLPSVAKGLGDGVSLTLTFTVLTQELVDTLSALLDSNYTLLLQTPEDHWYMEVEASYTIRDNLWDLRRGLEEVEQFTVPLIQVEAP